MCTLNIDIRITPTFTSQAADRLLHRLVAHVDNHWSGTRPTTVDTETSWPAYALSEDSPLRTALLTAAGTLNLAPQPKIAGPSNIGNYLASLGIPATAGFGVDYAGLHATDERIRIDTIPVVQAVYHTATQALLQVPQR